MRRTSRLRCTLRRIGLATAGSLMIAAGAAATTAAPAAAAPFGTPMTASVLGEDPIGPGVFRFPQGVAVDPNNGNVFVADQYSGIVQAFDGNGKFLFRFGARALRGETGRMGVVGGLSVDRSGHVWVLDSEFDRIQIFSARNGQYLASFGDATQFRVSRYGTRPDSGIAAGGLVVSQRTPSSSILVWVADSGNDRILRFAFSPQTLRPYGPPKSTSKETTPLARPQGVGVNAAATRLYVPDNQNHRVYVLSAKTLERVGVFGSNGRQPGQFSAPYDAAVDASRPAQLYVADNLNGRVNVFDAVTLQYVGTFGGDGRRVGRFSIVRSVASNPSDRGGGVWVADTSNNRIQRVSRTGEIVAAWGIQGRGPGYFTRPRGVAFHPDGRIFVADTFDSRVAGFTADGGYFGQYGRVSSATGHTAPGGKSNELLLPADVTIGPRGELWIADGHNNRIVRYTEGGQLIGSTRAGGLRRPTSLATGPDGSVYVASSFSNQILRFPPTGGSPTALRGVNRPSAVAVQQTTGTVFATSLRTVINATTGARIRNPEGGTTWDRPQGIAVTNDGTLYVSEQRPTTANGSRVLRGAPDGTGGYRWEALALEGINDGQVIDPANLALSPDERTLLVADAGNNRILRFDAPGSGPAARQPLRVQIDGGVLRGRVTSEPRGVDCGTDCSQLYGTSQTVTLTAWNHPRNQFAGWGGACAAAGTARTCTVSMAQAQDVIASFVPLPPPPVRIHSLSVSPTNWHLTRKKTKTRRTLKSRQATKATLKINLSEPATGNLEVLQARPGRKRGSGATATCVKASSSARISAKQRCTRFVRLPVAQKLRLIEGRTAAEVGPRFGRRTLAPGRYRLRLTVTDEASNTAVAETKTITLTR
jgi:DNA-binding beta-propeller fold protein YncE